MDDYSGYVAEVSYEGAAGHSSHQEEHGPGHGGAIGGRGSGDITAHQGIPSGGLDLYTGRPSYVGRNWNKP